MEIKDSKSMIAIFSLFAILIFSFSVIAENAHALRDSDRDYDGIVDELDKCPHTPENYNKFEDEDGCPDTVIEEKIKYEFPDTDGDGIEDRFDECVNLPETFNDYLDHDGCPENMGSGIGKAEDSDSDSVPDSIDACPNEKETINEFKDGDGCPDSLESSFSKTSDFIDGECRGEKIAVMRTHTKDIVCLSLDIAERWEGYGLAEILVKSEPADGNLVVSSAEVVKKLSELEESKVDAFDSQNNLPLSSWNDGDSKKQIVEFVNSVTDPKSPYFVPVKDRIATFDNDGTLWIERPLYIPFAFHLGYLYDQLETNPNLSSQSPYMEILEKQDSLSNEDLEEISGLFEILIPAYPEISQDEYVEKSKYFLDQTIHPKFNAPLKKLTYKPMVELIHYLQQNDFEVYIVSAGFQGLMRSVSDEIYNIEKQNVIGTHPEFIFKITERGPEIIRQPFLASFNDREEKPVNIQKLIGKKPILACGNSGGDIEMLLLTHHHEKNLACILDHDDAQREYFYPNSEALEWADTNDWLVISMKNDFKTIFESSVVNDSPSKVVLECSPEFWENNLELWSNVGVDYTQNFDETFGRDYFEPDITLEQAIKRQGVGIDHLARTGTTAYLNALSDPKFDEENVITAVNFGYVHQLDQYLANCNEVEIEIIP
ncbi:MAG: haloacid dehalogenase-like hydrolase [Nitrosopumilaceae archaeon]|uniref:Haloacid dehalogenase-like hydrolase n=1 Tax=Candidatus Nitrosomaritimum aestuariumsis TaxID=3342354 RepID=A0AC60WAP5_9ARCH|nr:haloacid dehalogenase-like hydrolase [Nitrosopumilaceae archaeon]